MAGIKATVRGLPPVAHQVQIGNKNIISRLGRLLLRSKVMSVKKQTSSKTNERSKKEFLSLRKKTNSGLNVIIKSWCRDKICHENWCFLWPSLQLFFSWETLISSIQCLTGNNSSNKGNSWERLHQELGLESLKSRH